MKGKAMVYLLGVAVLLVWGLIVYRIVAAVSTDDDAPSMSNALTSEKSYNDYEIKPDTGKLLMNYRDPFGMAAAPEKDTAAVKIVKPLQRPVVNAPLNWSFIRYSGFIRNRGSQKLIAIMSINGKNVMLSEGESDSDVKLLKNLKDSIKVSFKGRTTFIKIDHNTL